MHKLCTSGTQVTHQKSDGQIQCISQFSRKCVPGVFFAHAILKWLGNVDIFGVFDDFGKSEILGFSVVSLWGLRASWAVLILDVTCNRRFLNAPLARCVFAGAIAMAGRLRDNSAQLASA